MVFRKTAETGSLPGVNREHKSNIDKITDLNLKKTLMFPRCHDYIKGTPAAYSCAFEYFVG